MKELTSNMKLQRILPYSRTLLAETILPGEVVIDATAGNGYDTLFLAELVGEYGHVYAFDIQQAALDATTARIGKLLNRTTLLLDSHSNLKQYVNKEIGGATFNLGYFPASDDLTIVTKPDTTIQALQATMELLKKGGIITIAVYVGHVGGVEERDALLQYLYGLSQKDVQVIRYETINQQDNAPFLIAIEKLRDFDALS